VGIEAAAIDPWPNQRMDGAQAHGRLALRHPLYDEVGLGKTLDAGCVIRSLRFSGFVLRIRQRTAIMEVPSRDLFDTHTHQPQGFGYVKSPVNLEAVCEGRVSSEHL
jgi:hypothetical protein